MECAGEGLERRVRVPAGFRLTDRALQVHRGQHGSFLYHEDTGEIVNLGGLHDWEIVDAEDVAPGECRAVYRCGEMEGGEDAEAEVGVNLLRFHTYTDEALHALVYDLELDTWTALAEWKNVSRKFLATISLPGGCRHSPYGRLCFLGGHARLEALVVHRRFRQAVPLPVPEAFLRQGLEGCRRPLAGVEPLRFVTWHAGNSPGEVVRNRPSCSGSGPS